MGKGGMSHGEDGEEENMAAWLLGINNLKIQPFKLPPLGPHDARIRMKAVGICGSDVHYLKKMRSAAFIVTEPMVIGHECAGIIEEVGTEVKHLVPGDRVAVEPGISCWRCHLCKEGRYNLCPEMKFFATPPVHGSLANQIVHPADLCFKLPDNVSLEEGAMCEPLSVGVHACRRANVGPETNVLVMGAGPIGLVTMLAARAFGSPRIAIVDVDDHRLSVAKELGADETVKVSTNINDVCAEVKRIKEAMGAKVDITFDCAGFSKTMSTALGATSPGGKVCLVGMGHSEMTVPLTPAAVREVDVFGIFRYKNTWPLCIEFLRSGKIDVKPLITHRFGFSQKEVEEAFDTSARGGTAIKDVGAEVKRIKEAMGTKVDITFDCAGLSKTMSTALGATSPGGKVCLIGMGHSEMTVPLTPAAVREVDVVGVFRYKNTWPLCIEFLRSGKIDVKPLITHRFGFSQKEVEEAFETSARGGAAIKVMFNL